MIIISARRNFWDSNRLAETVNDRIQDVVLESTDLRGQPVTAAQLRQRVTAQRVLLLIHGYNNEPFEVARAYAEIERRVNLVAAGDFDIVLGYTWPGGDDAFDYFAAKNRAGAVARRLRRTLETLFTEAASVALMSHSMGCRLVYLALQDLERDGFQRQASVVTLNTASAVDNESIEIDRRYHRATLYADEVHVFHSKNDGVLSGAYRVAELDNALGLFGPEDPARTEDRVKVVNCKRVIEGHGDYKRSDEFFSHVHDIVTGQQIAKFSSL